MDSLEKKLDYMDRCSQLCAYAAGVTEPVRDGMFAADFLSRVKLCNIFISTSEPGKYLIREWSTEEKQRGWAIFRSCQNLWELTSNYFPLNDSPSGVSK